MHQSLRDNEKWLIGSFDMRAATRAPSSQRSGRLAATGPALRSISSKKLKWWHCRWAFRRGSLTPHIFLFHLTDRHVSEPMGGRDGSTVSDDRGWFSLYGRLSRRRRRRRRTVWQRPRTVLTVSVGVVLKTVTWTRPSTATAATENAAIPLGLGPCMQTTAL